ncbi:MAG: ATP-binding cassette domain-containing protein [Chlamydiae bacterium]|nr:ATP-binding cassette domain-containing protein [Chlamydiota bacterium]
MNLEINHLCKKHGMQNLFAGLSLSTKARVLGLVGPSGSGKSSLLRMIAGLSMPDSGTIHVEGNKVPQREGKELQSHRKSLGIVFQSYNLFPHLSAIKNIMLPLEVAHGLKEQDAYERASELLERFQLLDHANKRTSQLSGGQSQRVAILRALAHKPGLLLLDEPTSALDPVMTSEVLDLLFELKEEGTSFILVSHHLPFLSKIAEEMVFMAGGEIVEHSSTNTFFTNPSNPEVKSYLKTVLKYKQTLNIYN